MTNVTNSEVLGRRLTGVQYDLLKWDDEPVDTAIVDSVPMAVILAFDDFSVILRWDLRPPSEQLVMLHGGHSRSGPTIEHIDVSERWGGFMGAELVAVSWSQHESEEGIERWAVTLAFARVGEMVVALGEIIDGSLSYMPDNLIVTASRDVALSYRPLAALAPAWTTTAESPDV